MSNYFHTFETKEGPELTIDLRKILFACPVTDEITGKPLVGYTYLKSSSLYGIAVKAEFEFVQGLLLRLNDFYLGETSQSWG